MKRIDACVVWVMHPRTGMYTKLQVIRVSMSSEHHGVALVTDYLWLVVSKKKVGSLPWDCAQKAQYEEQLNIRSSICLPG